MLTSPYYDSGEQGSGQPWPENDPARVTTDNSLLMKAVEGNPTVASAINLGAANNASLTIEAAGAMSGTITALIQRFGTPE